MISAQLSERERSILLLLASDSSISVAQMSDRLGVSAVTIPGDLSNLSSKGIVTRTHGGAMPAFNLDVVLRQSTKTAEKEGIAEAAAEMVRDGDTIGAHMLSNQKIEKFYDRELVVLISLKDNPRVISKQRKPRTGVSMRAANRYQRPG